MAQWWPEPTAGDIVWCHFPDNINPLPKPRPALILAGFDHEAGQVSGGVTTPQFIVRVVYGTSQRTNKLYRGEFVIMRAKNLAVYEMVGLSYDTKFALGQSLDLPYTTLFRSRLIARRALPARQRNVLRNTSAWTKPRPYIRRSTRLRRKCCPSMNPTMAR